jgi:uncharacterized membrane protein YdbT with pleckstrin-like domain
MTVSMVVVVVVLAVLAVVTVLVTWLTAAQLRARRYRDEPVYRRLPNGRLRFEWTIHQLFQDAQRIYRRRSR